MLTNPVIKTFFRDTTLGGREYGDVVRYRVIQVLTRLQNHIWQRLMMPLRFFLVTMVAVTLYVLITSIDQIPVMIVVLFSAMAVNGFIVICVIYKILSYPLIASNRYLGLMKQKKASKCVTRFMKTCPPAKISMGDGKHFDKLASFVVCRQSIDLLISFLLLQFKSV